MTAHHAEAFREDGTAGRWGWHCLTCGTQIFAASMQEAEEGAAAHNERPIERLARLLLRETLVFRKGAEVTERDVGGVRVVEVFGYPETPSRGALVDVHFVNVGFTEAAADRDGFVAAVQAAAAEPGVYADVAEQRLNEGPSYIELGQWLGDQELALRLMALSAQYGTSRAPITPATLGADGGLADLMAGRGMVMLGGWRP